MSEVIVDSRYGKIIVDSNDRYLSRSLIFYGEFSEGEAQLFKQVITKDMIVVDCGANFGAHTLLFAQLARHVYAFEPQRYMFDALCRTIALNGLDNVTAFREAIGDGAVVKYRDVDTSQENNFGACSFVGATEGANMPTRVLDLPCHFLKIDVEGMELAVINGAAEMLLECQPIVYVENDRPDKSDALIARLEELNYDCYWDTPFLFNEDNFYGKKDDIFPGLTSINMLCVATGTNMNDAQRAVAGDWERYFHQNPDVSMN
jgi:FkbM family methyltransferase